MKNILFKTIFLILFAGTYLQQIHADNTLLLHYTFEPSANGQVNDVSGNGHNGVLLNGAKLRSIGEFAVADLGNDNGYINMGTATGAMINTLDDFSVAVNIFIDPSTNITGNGNFVWVFSTGEACSQTAGKYIAYRVNAQRYAQSTGGYANEKVGIQKGTAATKGSWQHVVYTQSGTIGTIYVNGTVLATETASNKPKDIGAATTYNWLGRPHFSGDAYLKNTLLSDFRVYNKALSTTEIAALCANQNALNGAFNQQEVIDAKNALEVENPVGNNLNLPTTTGNNIAVAWASDKPEIISAQGIVNRPANGQPAATVTLTATLTKDGYSETKTFTLTVIPLYSDEESVNKDLAALMIDNEHCLYQDIDLPEAGAEGSSIAWVSDKPEYLSNEGKLVALPEKGLGNQTVTFIATLTKGEVSVTRSFEICVAEDEGYEAYLFAYFTGNAQAQEQIRFALSMDGYNYTPLNNGNPIVSSDTIAIKKAVRDPHILRGIDGNTFYMVVTDMKSSEGWSSNDGLVLMKSIDMVNWTHTAIDFPDTWSSRFNRTSLTQVWAPQTIYDPDAGKYMVYYSIGESGQHYKIYYSYANEDFTTLTLPQVLYDHGSNTIDSDIVYMDDLYHLFFKTEGNGNGIQKATASQLTGTWTPNNTYLQQTTVAVEGSGVFKLINSDEWILMYDCYTSGYYQFCKSNDLDNFTWVCNTTTSGSFSPRHGTVIPITQEEMTRLKNKWSPTSLINRPLEKSSKTLTIYPNPVSVSGTLTIKLPEINNEAISFAVYSAQGSLMYRENKNKPATDETITLPACMRTGIYFLKTQYGNTIYHNKVLVN
ncbi:MAG: hypothetical protein EZS26_000920 [Candidatus Ordinivivax streblomastigis]|uniref:Uncharacterized protein n=1 Tax=Candidatus Ordinivivax streblomastigis TaxID=2540710 RepID=A0A5M8P3B8_9BACT|nr:MAG: hypothetical protein EZS26_000920 [Candidatus Ordinivivax streblomastigis]